MNAVVTTVIVPAAVVQLIISGLIPIATGLLTKYTLPGWIKGLMTLLFSALTAFFARVVGDSGEAVFTMAMVYNALFNYVIAVAVYFGIYKQANITSSTPTGKLLPQTGLG
jgi:hypothetical protein